MSPFMLSTTSSRRLGFRKRYCVITTPRWRDGANGRNGFENIRLIRSTPNHIRHSRIRPSWIFESSSEWLEGFKTRHDHHVDYGTTWSIYVLRFAPLLQVRTQICTGEAHSNKYTAGHLTYQCMSCTAGMRSSLSWTTTTNASSHAGSGQLKIMVEETRFSYSLSRQSRSCEALFGP